MGRLIPFPVDPPNIRPLLEMWNRTRLERAGMFHRRKEQKEQYDAKMKALGETIDAIRKEHEE